MLSHARNLLAVTFLAGSLIGCVPDKARLNSPPQGFSEPRHPMATYYSYHNDQGLLADMSLADLHFVAHSSELSSTGEARLCRYSELLAQSGGTIHYDTAILDGALVASRLTTANDYLKEAAPGKTVQVVLGIAGGPGMTAKEAKSARDVAKQAEPRNTAYKLRKYQQENSGK